MARVAGTRSSEPWGSSAHLSNCCTRAGARGVHRNVGLPTAVPAWRQPSGAPGLPHAATPRWCATPRPNCRLAHPHRPPPTLFAIPSCNRHMHLSLRALREIRARNHARS